MIEAFREGGGEGKPMVLQAHVSWAPTEEEALRSSHDQWRTNLFEPPVCWDLETVEHFDEAARHVRPEDVRAGVLVSSDPAQHVAWIEGGRRARLRRGLNLHHVGQEQGPFIEAFGRHVLPALA